MKKLVIIIIAVFVYTISIAQEKAMLGIPELKGKYEGEIKKGKAHGYGEATGIDHYKGEFRKGVTFDL